MKRHKWIADKYAERPAGKPGVCFYCGVRLGKEHSQNCTIRTRTVMVEVRATLIMTVPEDWEESMVEFHMNESSSCSDNLLNSLSKQAERMGCACAFVESKFVREATAEDEETYCMKISDAEC